MVASLSAPLTPADGLLPQLRERGYAVLAPQAMAAVCAVELDALDALRPSWDDLQPDHYLKDGGNYRKRRHSCFVVTDGAIEQTPHRAHWQSQDYNALHGGMHRWFEPISPDVVAAPAWPKLLSGLAGLFSRLRPGPAWHVEAHQFRIDTSDGIGRPTPEGAHRDGVDYVAVFLVGRSGIKGGETRVFEAAGPNGQRFTLTDPWSLLLLDDARVIHESTPIQPLDGQGHRDTLVLTYRAGAFQGED
ncbi:MAG: 2OG-Fe dioxygenase family protein [Luteimonas sp.]